MNRKKLFRTLVLVLVFVISFQIIALPASAASDSGQSALPTVDEFLETAETITGQGISGAMIIVIFPNGTAKTATVKNDNTWITDVPDDVTLNSGDEITAIQIENGKSPSDVVKAIAAADTDVDPHCRVDWEAILTGEPYATAGDLIEYRVELWNEGRPSSVWESPVAIVYLDNNITFKGSVRINGFNALPSQYNYDSSNHTLTIYLSNLVGGARTNFSFRARVNDDVPTTINEIGCIVKYY